MINLNMKTYYCKIITFSSKIHSNISTSNKWIHSTEDKTSKCISAVHETTIYKPLYTLFSITFYLKYTSRLLSKTSCFTCMGM